MSSKWTLPTITWNLYLYFRNIFSVQTVWLEKALAFWGSTFSFGFFFLHLTDCRTEFLQCSMVEIQNTCGGQNLPTSTLIKCEFSSKKVVRICMFVVLAGRGSGIIYGGVFFCILACTMGVLFSWELSVSLEGRLKGQDPNVACCAMFLLFWQYQGWGGWFCPRCYQLLPFWELLHCPVSRPSWLMLVV